MLVRPSVWVLHKSTPQLITRYADWLASDCGWHAAELDMRLVASSISGTYTYYPQERKTSINYPANETNPFGWWSVTSSRHRDGWRSRCHLVPVTKQYLSWTRREDWQEGRSQRHMPAHCQVGTLYLQFWCNKVKQTFYLDCWLRNLDLFKGLYTVGQNVLSSVIRFLKDCIERADMCTSDVQKWTN